MKHVFLTTTFVLCLLATSLRAQDEVHKTVPLNANGTVSVTNVSGYVRITSWNENRVQVDAVKRGERADFEQVEIRLSESAERLEITTVYPRNFWRPNRQVWVEIDLKVPRNAVLDSITTTSGDITITAAGSRVAARSTSGDITLRDINGDTKASVTSGDLTAERIGGTLTLHSTSGDVRLTEIAANVSATTTSGNITATDLRASVSVAATSGDIRVEKTSGRLQAQVSSGKITARDIGGDAVLQAISDFVLAENIKGRLTVTAVSADVTVRNVQEGVRVNSVSGTISITNTKGLIEARTTSGDIQVRDVESREVQLNAHSGTIQFSGTLFADGHYNLESFNGGIVMLIPAQTNFTVTATTYNGSIETDFPITIPPGTTQTNRPRRMQGSHGNPNGAQIKVGGFSADIKLKRH